MEGNVLSGLLADEKYMLQVQCVLKCLKMFLGEDVKLKGLKETKERTWDYLGGQVMDGDDEVFFGIGGKDGALKKIAGIYADEEFVGFDEDAYDAVCEMINCINGMFATKLGDDEVQVELIPPVFYKDVSCSSDKGFYVAVFEIEGMEFAVMMAVNANIVVK